MELSSSASAHRIGQKSLFPILQSWVSCWSRMLRIPPANKYLKKTLFMLFFCCRQIPMSHSLPMFIHLRNMGSWQWKFFFWCPVILIWHFYYFWAAQVILGLSRIHTKLLAGKAAFPVVLSNMFWPRATGVASSEGVTSQQSWDTPRPQHSFLFLKKIPITHSLRDPEHGNPLLSPSQHQFLHSRGQSQSHTSRKKYLLTLWGGSFSLQRSFGAFCIFSSLPEHLF